MDIVSGKAYIATISQFHVVAYLRSVVQLHHQSDQRIFVTTEEGFAVDDTHLSMTSVCGHKIST